jgi:hypothetical protein
MGSLGPEPVCRVTEPSSIGIASRQVSGLFRSIGTIALTPP